MITPTTIYWIGQCDCLRGVCFPMIVLGLLFGLVGIFITGCCINDRTVPRIVARISAAITLIFLVLLPIIGVAGCMFIPTSKTMAAMYIIPSIANNEKIQDAGDRLYTLAVEWMEELRPKAEGKNKDNNQ